MTNVYKGVAFPFQKGDESFPKAAVDDELVRHSIVQILLTNKGERIMRPEFGTGLLALIFEPNDDILSELVKIEVSKAIGRYEPRVLIQDIQTLREDSTVTVSVYFVVLATKQELSVQVSLNTGQF